MQQLVEHGSKDLHELRTLCKESRRLAFQVAPRIAYTVTAEHLHSEQDPFQALEQVAYRDEDLELVLHLNIGTARSRVLYHLLLHDSKPWKAVRSLRLNNIGDPVAGVLAGLLPVCNNLQILHLEGPWQLRVDDLSSATVPHLQQLHLGPAVTITPSAASNQAHHSPKLTRLHLATWQQLQLVRQAGLGAQLTHLSITAAEGGAPGAAARRGS
uniref:Uncharacterized protein n=1 Tax=Chlamydomonas leiostraca TaxID=1034604 RepID=A0A7S0WW73_9CHLO|mmetsp:Transcript_32087/g.81556  ORF Transcript_32087/g.81556 Transcript_32087/m.81556 type:complete len:213 (+) Transcript_32087:139-777(+)